MTVVADALVVSWTVACEDVEDGWAMARVVEKPGAISQGRTRAEARDNVRDALRELLLFEAEHDHDHDALGEHEPLELRIAP